MNDADEEWDTDWTPERRATLAAVTEHVFPLAGDEPGTAVIRTLLEGPHAPHEALVRAVLDELSERGVDLSSPQVLEAELRRLETSDNPYLAQGLRLLVAVVLETRLGDPARGGNPGGRAWAAVGLSPDGLKRAVGPP